MLAAIPSVDPHLVAQTLGQVIDPSKDPTIFLGVFVVVFARILGFMIVAPFFGGMNIPMTARVGFAVVLTAVTEPYAYDMVSASMGKELGSHPHAFDLLLMCVNQVFVGLMLGFCASFIFYAIESAGRIIDTQRGSNITDILAPQTGERTSPTGQYLNMVALMILLTSGLHMEMIKGLLGTFRIFPPTLGLEWLGDPLHASSKHPELTGVIAQFAKMSGDSLLLTLQIAAPAMITLMLTDVLLGIINRGAPQVNVFALSQVVKGPIGIFALMVALLPTWNYLRDHAIPRVCSGDSTIVASCDHEGSNSLTGMARKMQAADVAAQRAKRADAARSDSAGEVS
jgi:flagellar biosynthetic protein FliR